jgi:type IV pilus assembly protein PilY1
MCGLAAAGALLAALPTTAGAQGIITNGAGLALGLKATGAMNVDQDATVDPYNSDFVGLSFFTDYSAVGATDGPPAGPAWGDATSPGCLCEGWGVSADGVAGFDGNGFANLTVDSAVYTASTLVSTTHLTSLAGLSIVHDYHPSVSDSLYEATVTITNGTGADIADLRYRRVMDWDVPPTTFDEFVTIEGALLGDLIDSCDDGFETADPTEDCTSILAGTKNVDFEDSGPFDHGASFTFGFGPLAAGASKTFKIYYGAAATEAAALAALIAVDAEGIYSFGQASSLGGPDPGVPATFIFGVGGVGAPPVAPEPATLFLLSGGLAAAAAYRRRRK